MAVTKEKHTETLRLIRFAKTCNISTLALLYKYFDKMNEYKDADDTSKRFQKEFNRELTQEDIELFVEIRCDEPDDWEYK